MIRLGYNIAGTVICFFVPATHFLRANHFYLMKMASFFLFLINNNIRYLIGLKYTEFNN